MREELCILIARGTGRMKKCWCTPSLAGREVWPCIARQPWGWRHEINCKIINAKVLFKVTIIRKSTIIDVKPVCRHVL